MSKTTARTPTLPGWAPGTIIACASTVTPGMLVPAASTVADQAASHPGALKRFCRRDRPIKAAR